MLKKRSIYQIGLLPLALVAGPFVAELLLFSIFLSFLYFIIKEKKKNLFNENTLKIF